MYSEALFKRRVYRAATQMLIYYFLYSHKTTNSVVEYLLNELTKIKNSIVKIILKKHNFINFHY